MKSEGRAREEQEEVRREGGKGENARRRNGVSTGSG